MNKKEILIKKLTEIVEYIDTMNLIDIESKIYIVKYKQYINQLICSIKENNLQSSEGRISIGLIRGISDYDEICSDEKLWGLLSNIEEYYRNECKQW